MLHNNKQLRRVAVGVAKKGQRFSQKYSKGWVIPLNLFAISAPVDDRQIHSSATHAGRKVKLSCVWR